LSLLAVLYSLNTAYLRNKLLNNLRKSQSGTDIRAIQALLRHNDLETAMIYTYVLNQGGQGVTSPLDDLGI
jgi:site-specific recombinase XerD